MIVVDASALVAIGDDEPERLTFLEHLEATDRAIVSAINYVELGLVLIGRGRFKTQGELDEWLASLGVELAPDGHLGAKALAAYLKFGRGFHRAKLNLADCFAYALAKASDAPLLYKGDDFAMTDARSAVQPT